MPLGDLRNWIDRIKAVSKIKIVARGGLARQPSG